jgi:hypothetical protein
VLMCHLDTIFVHFVDERMRPLLASMKLEVKLQSIISVSNYKLQVTATMEVSHCIVGSPVA